MIDLAKIDEINDDYFREAFKLIAKSAHISNISGDAQTPIYTFGMDTIDELSQLQYEHNKSRMLKAGEQFQSPSEAYDDMLLRVSNVRMNGDIASIESGVGPNTNPIWRYGTLFDPTSHTHAQMPVSFGPMEATSVYTNGGLPAEIINKKTRAMVLNGASFKAYDDKFWDGDKIKLLEEAADCTGFNDKAADAICDSFLFGGGILYPVFETDSPTSFLRKPEKCFGKIDRWVTVDRWNITTVPNFIVTDRDYLNPDTILIPQANIELRTTRCAMVRPKSLPYWAAIYNMGWCPSDLTGWIRPYYAYEITQMSVPVMAQQMSLLLYRMPLDALNATIGVDNVKKLMAVNEEKMAEWNSLNPKAVNMIGEVEVINRTYSGFEQFVGATKSELASQTGIPEPSLWHTPNKGFSDNTQESLLKQSETLKLNQQIIERTMNPCRDALIAHVFGVDSKEWENRDRIKLNFNKPVISTEKDLAEVGARFAASVNSFVQAGVSPDVAIDLSKPFFPSVKITEEMIQKAKKSYEEFMDNQQKNKIGGSNDGPKTQAPSNRIF